MLLPALKSQQQNPELVLGFLIWEGETEMELFLRLSYSLGEHY